MKKLLLALFCLPVTVLGQDTIFVHPATLPVMLDRPVNIVYDLTVKSTREAQVLSSVDITLDNAATIGDIKQMEIYYTGGSSMLRTRTINVALEEHTNQYSGGQKIYYNPAYARQLSSNSIMSGHMELTANQKLRVGDNHFYVSVTPNDKMSLSSVLGMRFAGAKINGESAVIVFDGEQHPLRAGLAVRDAGDQGVHSYRIPGLVTSKKGTLLGVYDIRRNTNVDLQEDVQVGLSRSTDGGRTWEPMREIIDMRGEGGLLDGENGVGDPSILVDKKSGDIFVIALWTQAAGGRAWWNVRQGMDADKGAAQAVVVRSTDDGLTWSKPHNITSHFKDPSWYIHLQGPGRGITMADGTLVFPYQFVDSARMPHATIIYSKDHGRTWQAGVSARSNTTEAQVIELTPGVLMLNMRDNRGGSRAILTTADMGKTWSEHPTSRSSLIEPVCMASLIRVDDNILLFSNPDDTKKRTHMTIKASLDNGMTWLPENKVLLDEELGWGYSCLTMVDSKTVGILYEGSRAQMVFQTIPLKDIIKK